MAVTTPLGKDAMLLVGFMGHEAISQFFSFQLDVLAENTREKEIAFEKLLGQKITVQLDLAGGKDKRFFSGICSRVTQFERDATFTGYRMELVPQFWLLTRRAQSRVFQHMTVKAILQKVLEGLDVVFEIDEKGTLGHPRDYCVQYRETDFNFASRLMEEEGIYYCFRHTAEGHQMVLANTPQGHRDVPEANKVVYEERVTGGPFPRERGVTAWGKEQSLRSGRYTLRDHCFELPASNKPPVFQNLEARAVIQESVQVGKAAHRLKLGVEKVGSNDRLEIYDYPGEYAHRFDGVKRGGADQSEELKKIFEDNSRTAEIHMQEEGLAGLVIQGTSHCRQFVSGHKFTLEGHFNADGPYVLTSVAAADARKRLRSSKMIPGDWGKVGSGRLAQPLSSPPKGGAEAGFTGSCGGVRALPSREKGTARPGAMRNRSEPGQVIQAGFELG
jgi:type VI secretion system secreted protein VgrG